MNKAARKAVNLSVLQRHDPHISDILDSSSHVVVYKFDEDSQAWTKKGVEGTMFVFKRSTQPSYGFFIMNRLGLENLMVDLTGDMALQLTSDYIIYRDEKDIHGIWIYEPSDRDRIGEQLLECCKKAKEEDSCSSVEQASAPSTTSTSFDVQPSLQTSLSGSSPVDPLSKMLSEAMSRVRVSEASGAPLTPSSNNATQLQTNSMAARPSQAAHTQEQQPSSENIGQPRSSPSKSEIPSFLMAIISNGKEKSSGPGEGSPLQQQRQARKDSDSTQAMLLNSLTGPRRPSSIADYGGGRQNGPLSAELLPASVMPSGLYSSGARHGGDNSGQGTRQSPSQTVTGAAPLNRPNGVPPQASPLQAAAFAYSPGMMPSPLVMPMMPGGPLMRPPPPPPLPFQHHPMGPGMGMPPPPPPPQAPSFPADAMHAAMGAVGFMQQRQRGFVGHGTEVMSKAEFSQQFLGLLHSDPQFMDVLYSNYAAVLARRA